MGFFNPINFYIQTALWEVEYKKFVKSFPKDSYFSFLGFNIKNVDGE